MKKYDIYKKMIKEIFALIGLLSSVLPAAKEESFLDAVQKKVVEIGKLKFLQEVPVRYMDREEMTRYIEGLFLEEYPKEETQKEIDFAVMMGFVNGPFPLEEIRKRVITENVGGLYNEKKKELLALEEFRSMDLFNGLALIHEFRHAIQDQHFQLAKMLGSYSDYDDRKLAALAAIEGDATFVMLQYMDLDGESFAAAMQPETLLSMAWIPGVASLNSAPAFVKYQILMPYVDGLKFTTEIHKQQRWSGVNSILKKLPQSSEQILHPEKYLRNEKPISITIRWKPDGWEKYFSGIIGEYFLNVLLQTGENLQDSAVGWGGDCFELYRHNQSRMVIWKSSWDSQKDAVRFSSDFRHFLERKFQVKFRPGIQADQSFQAGQSDADFFFLHQKDKTIFFVRTSHREEMNHLIHGGVYD